MCPQGPPPSRNPENSHLPKVLFHPILLALPGRWGRVGKNRQLVREGGLCLAGRRVGGSLNGNPGGKSTNKSWGRLGMVVGIRVESGNVSGRLSTWGKGVTGREGGNWCGGIPSRSWGQLNAHGQGSKGERF